SMPALSQTRNTTIRPYLLKTLPNKVHLKRSCNGIRRQRPGLKSPGAQFCSLSFSFILLLCPAAAVCSVIDDIRSRI
ncbi:hypothetical protein, partial [Paraburkholderia sp. UYCP14C]|uniref:hypothetical protein n=1 Tax=Paraburkholderia sp. UYCP14C TaxID=2511130 RepID=UPI001B7D729D